MNYVPFAERSLDVVVDLYQKTACHKAVVNEKVLQNIIKVSFKIFILLFNDNIIEVYLQVIVYSHILR